MVGISAANQNWDDAWGAFLLFMTNFVAIVLAASLVFVMAGFAVPDDTGGRRLAAVLAPFGVLAMLILLPLTVTTEGTLARSAEVGTVQQSVDTWLGEQSPYERNGVSVSADRVEIDLVGPLHGLPALEPLQDALISGLGRDVGVSVQVTPVEVTELPRTGETVRPAITGD
ncbi:hypothetical protein GCM10025865_03820 [Paraoerskovia sediminicola]|uniref:Alkaline shock response membrane anchor protein AmaP n=1 Tax=Paraoerskovia sediminicola TaxID=1138587 RepID=A0ABM8FZF9_9CELL|nr:hypothetical protein GCM10025865_03820 [Paraoerskovia sediminicola]